VKIHDRRKKKKKRWVMKCQHFCRQLNDWKSKEENCWASSVLNCYLSLSNDLKQSIRQKKKSSIFYSNELMNRKIFNENINQDRFDSLRITFLYSSRSLFRWEMFFRQEFHVYWYRKRILSEMNKISCSKRVTILSSLDHRLTK
jgi:hypothetical protein